MTNERLSPAPMTLAQFQQLIRDKYFATDNARGAPGTYLWFVEEVGELAHAIANRERGKLDQANLEEEFADVLAWLATLANICGVDLTRAIHDKYVKDGGPEGFKV
ncbi:MAG: MazG nucleotide pyrophosphohydrolase domain-containing protein [Planctomycetota bacterium]